MEEKTIVIDGKGAILGRLGSRVAKMLLLGNSVHIVNSESMLFSGSLQVAKEKYLHRLTQKHKADPSRSPKWPKVPHMLVKRIIKGMLPHKSARGREAIRRLKAHMGVPKELESQTATAFPEFSGTEKKKQFSVLDLCREIGYNG